MQPLHRQTFAKRAVANPVILFLDFDGVLHPDPCFDEQRLFERAPMLQPVLEEFAEICVVLSTSWRTQYELSHLVALLPSFLQSRTIGVTPLFSAIRAEPGLAPFRREAECVAWLAAHDHRHQPWIAIDDRASMFTPYCERLICCDSSIGLTEAIVTRLHSHCVRARTRLARQVDALL